MFSLSGLFSPRRSSFEIGARTRELADYVFTLMVDAGLDAGLIADVDELVEPQTAWTCVADAAVPPPAMHIGGSTPDADAEELLPFCQCGRIADMQPDVDSCGVCWVRSGNKCCRGSQ